MAGPDSIILHPRPCAFVRPCLETQADARVQGLDSQGAISIVRLLRRLADAGQAIICTIHQANQEQFELVSSNETGLCAGFAWFANEAYRAGASSTTSLPSTVAAAFTISERRAPTGRRCLTTSPGTVWLRHLTRT